MGDEFEEVQEIIQLSQQLVIISPFDKLRITGINSNSHLPESSLLVELLIEIEQPFCPLS
jgi:hypothetical protein